MSEKTTRVSEDLELVRDTFLPNAGNLPGNSLDNREKTPPKAFDEYLGAPDGGAKAWSVVLG